MSEQQVAQTILVKCKGCGAMIQTDRADWQRGPWCGVMRLYLNFVHERCGWQEKLIA